MDIKIIENLLLNVIMKMLWNYQLIKLKNMLVLKWLVREIWF